MGERISLDPLLLLLLYFGDSKGRTEVRGRTKLEKLLFLVIKELEKRGYTIEDSDYIPYTYGPFSTRVFGLIDSLSNDGEIDIRKENDIEIFDLSKEKRKELSEKIPRIKARYSDIVEVIQEIKRRFNELSTDFVTAYVYLKYPEFTNKSVIRDKIIETIIEKIEKFREFVEKTGISERDLLSELKLIRKRRKGQ